MLFPVLLVLLVFGRWFFFFFLFSSYLLCFIEDLDEARRPVRSFHFLSSIQRSVGSLHIHLRFLSFIKLSVGLSCWSPLPICLCVWVMSSGSGLGYLPLLLTMRLYDSHWKIDGGKWRRKKAVHLDVGDTAVYCMYYYLISVSLAVSTVRTALLVFLIFYYCSKWRSLPVNIVCGLSLLDVVFSQDDVFLSALSQLWNLPVLLLLLKFSFFVLPFSTVTLLFAASLIS